MASNVKSIDDLPDVDPSIQRKIENVMSSILPNLDPTQIGGSFGKQTMKCLSWGWKAVSNTLQCGLFALLGVGVGMAIAVISYVLLSVPKCFATSQNIHFIL